MTSRPVSRLVWRIGRRYPWLRERLRSASHRTETAAYLDTVLHNDDDEWPLTRPGEAAIPLAQRPDQPVHTWFAGLAGYCATLREHLEQTGEASQFHEWWSTQTTLVQFLGFDCTYSHAVAYASLLGLEAGGPARVHHFTNRFLKLNGEDFSTSRNHAIWVKDMVSRYPADAVRFYTALHSPEREVRNFTMSDFELWYETHFQRLMNGGWREPGRYAPRVLSNGASQRCAALVDEWHAASSLSSFSIGALASIQMRLLQSIADAAESDRMSLWLLFAELGESLHPSLSAQIRTSLCGSQRGPRGIEMILAT